MSVERHPLHAQKYRNERKRILFEKWLTLGLVQVNFDATHAEVAILEKFKGDHDYWLAVVEAEIYTSHFEGLCTTRQPGIKPFQFSVPWDAVHALYSAALHERHIYLEDVNRATKRQETLNMSRTGRPIPC